MIFITKRCTSCGLDFEVMEPFAWQNKCRPCWNRQHAADAEVKLLKAENAQLKVELERARALPRLSAPRFDAGQWRRLVGLCHPDKHNGSAAATEATQWLLRVRGAFH